MAKYKPVETLTYEEAFSELEAIVADLEAGEHPLEESTIIFARGQELVKHCATLLEKTELKIRELTGESVLDPEEQK